MKIQIVVPAINLWKTYTNNCLNSLYEAMIRAKSHGIDSKILLIDNASTDETKEMGPKLNTDLVDYQRNEERWGFQKSVNYGVNYGIENQADYILVCNNDIIIHPEAIWKLADRFEKGDVGMVTAMDVRGEMDDKGLFPPLISSLLTSDKEAVEEATHPNFSAFMISKGAWELIGEFDEIFYPAYFEDNDYHYRMDLLEIPAMVLPTAMFYHYGSKTQNEANETGQPMVPGGAFENNRAEYVKKWGGVPTAEKFKCPYNDENKSVLATKQKPND